MAHIFERHVSSILRLWLKFQRTVDVEVKSRRHRTKVTTPAQDAQIIADHTQDCFKTSTATALGTNGTHGIHVSTQTVLRRLSDQGIIVKRPFLVLFLHNVIGCSAELVKTYV